MDLRKTRLWGDSLRTMVEDGDGGGSRTRTLVGHVPDLSGASEQRAQHATRLLPIERLLLAEREAREQSTQTGPEAPEEEVVLPTRRFPSELARRGAIVLLLLAIAGFKLYARKPVRRAPAAATVQAAPALEVKPVAVEAPPVVPSSVGQRAAVDALASGDYQAAQSIYDALARSVEGRSAYSEAARILRERTQVPAR
jgi:hypothetical protein